MQFLLVAQKLGPVGLLLLKLSPWIRLLGKMPAAWTTLLLEKNLPRGCEAAQLLFFADLERSRARELALERSDGGEAVGEQGRCPP